MFVHISDNHPYAAVIIAMTVLVLLLCLSTLGASKENTYTLQTEQNDRPVFTGPRNPRQVAVVESFKHAWKGYKKHAWGHNHLEPVSGKGSEDGENSLGLTIVDSLDTAYIMGLTEDLGERLMAAFSSRSGIPYVEVNLGTQRASVLAGFSTTSEVTTIQLEFRELSRATGNLTFEHAAMAVSEKIHAFSKEDGLVPIYISHDTGNFIKHSKITLGAGGDSYYEYLLTQWLQTGKTIQFLKEDYETAIEGVRDILARRTLPNKYLFIGELDNTGTFNPKMDHLACFLPGTLALGYANKMPAWHMKMAEELLYTCYLMYEAHPTFLAPEIMYFNTGVEAQKDMYTKDGDAHSILRSEFVESLWIMYQITGNTTYQEWGWKVFQAFEKHAKVSNGYTSLHDVTSDKPGQRDDMNSLFLSETIKYLYLLFSDDGLLIDLKKYVMNAGAHPLPIYKN